MQRQLAHFEEVGLLIDTGHDFDLNPAPFERDPAA
jgi:hypothetical protein